MKKQPPGLISRLIRRLDRYLDRQRQAALLAQFASCGEGVSIQLPVVINHADRLTLGDRVSINAFVHIWALGGVTIGSDTLIASHVAITTLTHDVHAAKYSDSLKSLPIVIGRNVWIGTHAVILPGITIGDDAIIGAGAVVTHDVAPATVVVGIPAAARR